MLFAPGRTDAIRARRWNGERLMADAAGLDVAHL